MKELALSLPDGTKIQPVSGMPGGGMNTIQGALRAGITIAFWLALLAALLFIIYGGISWITSGGEKEKIAEAQKKVTYAIIGLIIIFMSYFIIRLVGDLFQVSLLTLPIK